MCHVICFQVYEASLSLSLNLLLLDRKSVKFRHSWFQGLPSSNIHLLLLCDGLDSFDRKAQPVYLLVDSDRLGILAFVLVVIIRRQRLVWLYKNCLCAMFSSSDCFSVTSKYVLSNSVLFITIGIFISWLQQASIIICFFTISSLFPIVTCQI